MKYFIGIDNGGTLTKAVIFDQNGAKLAACGCAAPLSSGQNGFQERDMEALWASTASAVKSALAKADIPAGDIAGVGCTGHGKGLYLWGLDGRSVRPAIASTDRRALDIVRRWNADGTAEKASRLTLQPVIACQPAPLLAWIRENEPSNYANIRWIFEAKDYIRFRLTGEARAEITDYSGTSLMNLHTREFDDGLLSLWGLGGIKSCLPPLCRSDEVCGRVTAAAAAATGIPEGTPVCGGMFDIDACAIAMDITGPGRLCVITGTWSINEYLSPVPADISGTAKNSVYCMPEYFLIEESSPTSAGNLEWVRGGLLGGLHLGYDEIGALVDSVSPEESGVVFIPFLYGSNTDGLDDAVFFGLKNSHGPTHLLRAVFEGVVFSHRTHLERLPAFQDREIPVRLAGGAAASAVWVRMFADCLGRTIELVPVKELGALGCAIAAAVASGIYADYREASKAMSPKPATVRPDMARHAIYQRKYEKYLRLIGALRGI